MKVLVTGGAGFIGSHSVDTLLDAGHSVAVVDDLTTGRRSQVSSEVEFYEMDVRSEKLASVFEKFRPTHVLHLAAHLDVRVSVERPLFDADVNVLGMINLLRNSVEHKVETFVFSSTGGAIYGEPEHLPATEQTVPVPLCPYGVSKMCAEHYVEFFHHAHSLKYTILRYGNVYGPRQDPFGEAGVCAILAGLMLDGKTPTLYGDGNPVRDYVYVGDVVRANLLALEGSGNHTLNIATGHAATVRDLFDIMRDATEFEGDPILAPLRPGEVDKIYLSADRAQEKLGWSANVKLRDGLVETVRSIEREREAARSTSDQ